MSRRRRNIRCVTSPCYYINGKPHVGHLYSNVLSQVIGKKLNWRVLNGIDCHGKKIRDKACEYGLEPTDMILRYGIPFKRYFLDSLEVNDYLFCQTHSKKHFSFVRRTWRELSRKGLIYSGYYRGYYSVQDETFVNEPFAGCTIVSERNYFLNIKVLWRKALLSYFRGRIRIYPGFYFNKVLEYVREVKDFCVSRNEVWGVGIPGCDDRTTHVWFDALLYYLSSINYRKGDKVSLVQVIGKDILSFHSWHWILILEALEVDYSVILIVHGWLLNAGEKISKRAIKSQNLNNSIGFDDLSRFFLSGKKIGLDVQNLSLAQSRNLFFKDFVNLVNRTLRMLELKQIGFLRTGFRTSNRTLGQEIRLIKGYNRFISTHRLWIDNDTNLFKIKNMLGPYVCHLIVNLGETNHLRGIFLRYKKGYLLNVNALQRTNKLPF